METEAEAVQRRGKTREGGSDPRPRPTHGYVEVQPRIVEGICGLSGGELEDLFVCVPSDQPTEQPTATHEPSINLADGANERSRGYRRACQDALQEQACHVM